jgi:hypothetical protein
MRKIGEGWSRRVFVQTCVASVIPAAGFAAVRGDKAMYVGGTLTDIPEKTEGRFDLTDEAAMKFTFKKGGATILYKNVTSIEYGQKAGRRVGVALAVTPFALFSKKRKHYVTLGFTDQNGKSQGAVFEISKGTIRRILTTLEQRTGKRVEYESEEAKKNIGG